MSRGTKFVLPDPSFLSKIYASFMVPKPTPPRLSLNMQITNMNLQTWGQVAPLPQPEAGKESKLKLNLGIRNQGNIVIVHCQGRIVYRDESIALAEVVGGLLEDGSRVILDLQGVATIDSAGIGELAFLQTWARDRHADLRLAGPNSYVSSLLALTNLQSVIEVHQSLESALNAFESQAACAPC